MLAFENIDIRFDRHGDNGKLITPHHLLCGWFVINLWQRSAVVE